MDAHHLSKRLEEVASFVPDGSRLADIGSDHAYLPANLALNGRIEFAVAGEVVRGPFENAEHEIRREGLAGRVCARLADGLAAIAPEDAIDVITICGMGGPLIRTILEEGREKLALHPLLILQPNVGEENVRRFLNDNGYWIEAERILEEDGHTYEIIVGRYHGSRQELTDDELKFGPFLMKERSSAFVRKWKKETDKERRVLGQLEHASRVPVEKKRELEAEILRIEGVLNG